MYNGIGLTTPRGSGTSGYVVRNLSTLRSYQNDRDRDAGWDAAPPKHREPDQGILEHERKRAVEVKCLELQVKLEDEEVDEAEIDKQVSALRDKLLANLASSQTNVRALKPSDTHALAAAKKVELERMARALGTRNDYQEGDSFDREKQEEMRLKRMAEREERDRQRMEDKKRMEDQKKKWEEERRKRDDERRKYGDRDRPRDMAPPPLPGGPRGGPPPRDRDDGYRRRDRSPPPRSRDVDMRDRSPPPRSRKRSPSHSPVRSRSRSPGYGRHKRRAADRSISPPPRRSRSPDRRDRRRRASSSPSRSRSPSRGRSDSRSSSGSRSDSGSRSRSRSRPRSPYGGRRGVSPPPSASRKPPVPVPTPGYTRDKEIREVRERVPPPHFQQRGSSPPRGPPPGKGRRFEKSPPRRGSPPPPPRGRTPERRAGGGRGRSASSGSGTGSSMSVSSGSRSRSRD